MSDEIRDAVAQAIEAVPRMRVAASRKMALEAADAVLALPQIREALSLRSSLDPCPRCGTGVVSICLGCKTQQAERERDEARAAIAAAQARLAQVRTAVERGREKRPYLGWGDYSPEDAVAGVVGQILLDVDEILAAAPEVKPGGASFPALHDAARQGSCPGGEAMSDEIRDAVARAIHDVMSRGGDCFAQAENAVAREVIEQLLEHVEVQHADVIGAIQDAKAILSAAPEVKP